MTLSKVITHHYHQLNAQDKKVLNRIQSLNEEIGNMTSQELADICFISRTSLSRLLKKIGFDSFAELKYLMKEEDPSEQELESDFESVLKQYHLYIDQIFSRQQLQSIVSLLLETDILYLYGTGNEQKLEVEAIRHLFTSVGKKVSVIFDQGEYEYARSNFSNDSLFWIVSYKGEGEEGVAMLTDAQTRGVKTLVLTRTSHNRLASMADFQLYVPTDSLYTKTRRTYEISTTFYFIIDKLYMAYCHERVRQEKQ